MKHILALILCLLAAMPAHAELTSGIYRLKSTLYGRYMYEDLNGGGVCTADEAGDTEYHKLWKVTVDGSNATLQNLYTGHYVQTQSSTSSQFVTGKTAVGFALTEKDGGWMFMSGSYMHCSASQGYMVVNWWDANSNASIWATEEVTLTETELEEIHAKYVAYETHRTNSASYNTALQEFFTDLSCSALNTSAQGMTDEALTAAMAAKGLPTTLQQAALKVKNQWADETEPAVVQRLRVKDYRAYTPAYTWRSRLNATQLTDLNNPTGIFADGVEELAIFVGGNIPEGCSLRMVALDGINRANFDEGVTLHEGYNVMVAGKSHAQLWVMYTYTGETDQRMAELPVLKIHIEGGKAYGCCDVTGMDETAANTEYRTMMTHATTMATENGVAATDIPFVVKGNYGVFLFPLDTYQQVWGTTPYNGKNYTTDYNIYKSIHWFDNVLAWEWSLMGFMKRVTDGQTDAHEHVTGGEDVYPTFCNNLALTLQVGSDSNPYSTTGYTAMPGTWGVESSYNAERADFDNWCAGHESGHNNQGLLNLPSSTEASNNLFANLVTYLHGYRLSRGEPVATTNADYGEGKQFALRNIASTHRMYWQLYLYYHEAARKTDFYPTLFNLLRSDPLDLNTGECFTKFYKTACRAAGEDLTEFFRAWGFFIPFENTTFGDYTTRTLTLTQSQIDAAIAEVKGWGYAENHSIIFIEDRIEPSLRWDPWANGTTDMRVTHSHAIGTCGELGSVNDFAADATPLQADYNHYSMEGNTLTMNGEGGTGFLVYNTEGELVAFSNSRTFTLPAETAAGGFSIVAVNADGTTTEVRSVTETGTDAEKREALRNTLQQARTMTAMADDNRVGCFKTAALEHLTELADAAQETLDMAHAARYAEMTEALNTEMNRINTQGDIYRVTLTPGNHYTLRSHLYSGRYMTVTDDNKLTTNTVGEATDAEKWTFTASTTAGRYHIQSKKTGKYISTIATSVQATAVAETTADAYAFSMNETSTGVFALNTNAGGNYAYLHCAASQSNTVVGWTGDAGASQWEIVLAEVSEDNAAAAELATLVEKTEMLLGEVTTDRSYARSKVALQTTDAAAPGYLSTNAQEPSEGAIANLIDGNTDNYFHTQWSGTGPAADHHLLIDMGEGEEIGMWSFWFSNRKHASSTWSGQNSPTNIVVEASEDAVTFESLATLTTADGLPTATGGISTFTSPNLGRSSAPHRYLRLTVTATNTGGANNGHVYFALGEFELYRLTPDFTLATDYAGTDMGAITTAAEALDHAKRTLADGTAEEKAAETALLQTAYDALAEAIANGAKAPLRDRLQELIADTEALLAKVVTGTLAYHSGLDPEGVTLQTGDPTAAYYLSTNAQEPSEGAIANLLDGNTGTYFHSTWSGTQPSGNHYLQIDMGEDDDIGIFSFGFTNRKHASNTAENGKHSPTEIVVKGSADGSEFTEITTLTTADGLPTATGTVSTFASGNIGNPSPRYRYLRLEVTATNTSQRFFTLSEFNFARARARSLEAVKAEGFDGVSDDAIIFGTRTKQSPSLRNRNIPRPRWRNLPCTATTCRRPTTPSCGRCLPRVTSTWMGR